MISAAGAISEIWPVRLPLVGNHPTPPTAAPHHPGRPRGCPRVDTSPRATSDASITCIVGLKAAILGSKIGMKVAFCSPILQPYAASPASQAFRRSPAPTIHHYGAIMVYFWKITILVLILNKYGPFLALI